MDICDLHCDLLCYLAHDSTRSPSNPEVRCSIPQLNEGGVKSQVLPIFTSTEKGSAQKGMAQWGVYKKLQIEGVRLSLAVENCSALCEEDEPLANCLERLDRLGSLTYASLTWNGENRFGGGAGSTKGLKEDGKELLRHLSGKRIAVDFSHASDWLAYDILNQMDREGLDLPILASHSNFRAVHDAVRNLPDDLAVEIFKRGGVIGINFVKMFTGPTPDYYVKQIEHALALGGEDQLCLGADFFYGMDVPADQRKPPEIYWFEDFGNASCYPRFFQLLKGHFSEEMLRKLAHGNFNTKIERREFQAVVTDNNLQSSEIRIQRKDAKNAERGLN